MENKKFVDKASSKQTQLIYSSAEKYWKSIDTKFKIEVDFDKRMKHYLKVRRCGKILGFEGTTLNWIPIG